MLNEVLSRTVASIIFIFSIPLFIIISLISIAVQGPPVFFRQNRVGYQFTNMSLIKFRTMKNNCPGTLITKKGDIRITLWGRFLRKLKLDEIPQLWNILKGEMRFIGPRPEVPRYVKEKDFSFLKKVKPGMSDFSSILLRDESRVMDMIGGSNAYEILLPLKIQLANIYAKNKGMGLDILLILLTVIAIFFPKTAQNLLVNYVIKRFNPELIPVIFDIFNLKFIEK